jgi:enamine deaminase RidA (YjgF/YER057c/UK114 family)
MPAKPRVNTKDRNMNVQRHEVGPRMSQIAIHGGVCWLAGQVPKLTLAEGIGAQTREVLGTVERLLLQAGSDKSLILSCQIFLRSMDDFAGMNAVWDAWVTPGATPPRATVQAAMNRPDTLIEVVVTAACSVQP